MLANRCRRPFFGRTILATRAATTTRLIGAADPRFRLRSLQRTIYLTGGVSGTICAKIGSNRFLGSVLFDGTDIAEFHGSLDNGPLETIRFDLKTGLTLR